MWSKIQYLRKVKQNIENPGSELPNNLWVGSIDPRGSNEILQLYSPITHYTGRVERDTRKVRV